MPIEKSYIHLLETLKKEIASARVKAHFAETPSKMEIRRRGSILESERREKEWERERFRGKCCVKALILVGISRF